MLGKYIYIFFFSFIYFSYLKTSQKLKNVFLSFRNWSKELGSLCSHSCTSGTSGNIMYCKEGCSERRVIILDEITPIVTKFYDRTVLIFAAVYSMKNDCVYCPAHHEPNFRQKLWCTWSLEQKWENLKNNRDSRESPSTNMLLWWSWQKSVETSVIFLSIYCQLLPPGVTTAACTSPCPLSPTFIPTLSRNSPCAVCGVFAPPLCETTVVTDDWQYCSN